jgi:hypothetical protein
MFFTGLGVLAFAAVLVGQYPIVTPVKRRLK